jgi:hypothetical protein
MQANARVSALSNIVVNVLHEPNDSRVPANVAGDHAATKANQAGIGPACFND